MVGEQSKKGKAEILWTCKGKKMELPDTKTGREASWIFTEKGMQKVGVAKEVICCGEP